MKLLYLLPCNMMFTAAALAQISYPDATGEVIVPGGSFPHLDITSVEVTADTGTNKITFKIFVEGDPTSPDWGNYMVGIKSGAGGTTTGWDLRPISFPSGMTHWIGTSNTGGQIYTYETEWTQIEIVARLVDSATRSISLTIPFAVLGLEAGEVFTFDVFSSGGDPEDSAVDALSAAESSITDWKIPFASTEPLTFTMPTSSDTDGDGLPDAWEMAQFGNLGQGPAGDPDGDLLANSAEFTRSTNPTKADSDTDGLTDKVEDSSGVYAGPASPGSNPLNSDTDNDTHLDGAEATGTALGYESNPLLKNYAVFAVPGNFNAWDPAGGATPSNAMSAAGTSLVTQYQQVLDYQFTTVGQAIQFKFAGGSWSDNWGGTTGTGVPGGVNITATIAASGVHRFTFDQSSLAYGFSRPTFPDAASFLAAYDLAGDPNGDADGDGLTNTGEFAGNSDPTNLDTDGDAVEDDVDLDPLQAVSAYDLWIAATSVPADARDRTADPDTDGLPNIGEFLFGGDPASGLNAAGGVLTVSAGQPPAGPSLIVRWVGRTAATEATYTLESTTTFAPGWDVVTATQEAAADQGGVPAGYTRWEAAVPVPSTTLCVRVVGTEL